MSNKLSVVMITKNEESNIEACLKSIQWADEIVVYDSGSSDETVAICRKFGCKVIQGPWKGFGPTKRMAVEHATFDWILSLDADERVSAPLRLRIQQILIHPECHGYRIRRHSYYLGHRIRFSGWQFDRPLRLFHRQFGNFNEKVVHESVRIHGPVGNITEPIVHYPYPTLESHIAKMSRYAFLAAQGTPRHRCKNLGCVLFHGVHKFLKMYVFQFGFLDGWPGLVLAKNSAFGVYLKYLSLWLEAKTKP